MESTLTPPDTRVNRTPMRAVQFHFPARKLVASTPRTTTLKNYEKKSGTEKRREIASRSSLEGDVKRREEPPSVPGLPPIGMLPFPLELALSPKAEKSRKPEVHRMAYTSLSNYNKVFSKGNKEESSVTGKTKMPFALRTSDEDGKTPAESQQTSTFYHRKYATADYNLEHKKQGAGLNRTLDGRSIAEQILEKKNGLIESVKKTDYGEIEGGKTYAKCFISAIHSVEEHVEDSEIRYYFIKLIASLHKNWKSFLESVIKKVMSAKDDLYNQQKREKSLVYELEAEKKALREKLEKERAKFELKPVVQELRKLTEKYNQLKINMEKEKKDLSNQISLLTVNNKKLSDALKASKEETDIVRMTGTIQNLRTELHQLQETLKKEKEEKSNSCFKLYTLLDAAKKEIKDRDTLIEEKNDEYNELLKKYNKILKELEENKALMKENMENMAMTMEDILQIKLRLSRKEGEIAARDDSLKEADVKINELETQLKLQREGLVQKKEISMESTLFYFVYDNPLGKLNNNNKSKAREGKQDFLSEMEEPKSSANKAISERNESGEAKLDTINLKKYMYLRPTYRSFISSLLPAEEHKTMTYAPSFPVWLQVTIRAIFDSKFNEYLLSYNKGRQMSRFPEFVFAWLGTFGIDKETRNVKLLEYTERDTMAAEGRVNILLGLESASSGKLWEVHIFKDFLEENLSLDELAFFLHCRFLMFKGPQLAVATAGFCVTHFVTKDRVNDTIDRVLYKSKPDERKDLKKKLVEFNKATYKDSNAFDYAMVLRILLEFYRKERKENFVKLEEICVTAKKSTQLSKTSITFESFYRIIAGDYDKSITDQEVSGLYREAFIGGGCAVNADSILLTFCETPFWVKFLRLKGQNAEPKYDARGDIDQSEDKGKECAMVYKHWEENEEFFNKVRKYLIESGCHEQLAYFENLENYIRWKGKEDSAKYSGKGMTHVYRLIWILILELWEINEEKQQFNNDPEFKHDLEKELTAYKQLGDLLLAKLDNLTKLEDKKKAAVTFEQTIAKATKGTDLLTKIQDKMREQGEASPTHRAAEKKEVTQFN